MAYSYQHGIVNQWMAGKLDSPGKFNYCAGVAGAAIVMYAISACWCCCAGGVVVYTISKKLKRDREQRMEALEKTDPELFRTVSTHIESGDFKAKCEKAFKEADADGNGKLDLTELQHVVLFDLSEEEKAEVTKHHLFDEAFVKKDANHDNFIDQSEFTEVMKWVQVTAKAKLAE